MTKYDAKISGSLLVQLENHTSFLKFYGHFRVSDLNLIIYSLWDKVLQNNLYCIGRELFYVL